MLSNKDKEIAKVTTQSKENQVEAEKNAAAIIEKEKAVDHLKTEMGKLKTQLDEVKLQVFN